MSKISNNPKKIKYLLSEIYWGLAENREMIRWLDSRLRVIPPMDPLAIDYQREMLIRRDLISRLGKRKSDLEKL